MLEESSRPVVATHANARAVFDHPRNFTDDQIRLLADSGGVLNLIYIPRFIGPHNDPIEGLLQHFRYVRDLVGLRHVGIGGLGTDADEIAMFGSAGWPYERLAKVLAERPKDLRTSEQIDKMTDALGNEGLNDSEIDAVFGGNLLRALTETLDSGEGVSHA